MGAEALHLEFPTGVIFESVSLGLAEGDRVGIVGRNGDGKTSLLHLLAGRLPPDGGQVTVRRGTRIGLVEQVDALDPSRTVAQTIVGDVASHTWASNPRIREVLDGLVVGVPWEATIGSLSGGQRRRVALAATLVGDHDLLFLDEPTNHLDLEGITWLARHLQRRWPAGAGAVVVVTHDRWFLDEVCTATWEVHDRTVEPFEGGYAAYVLQRVERDRMAAASESKRQNLLRKELAWLRRGPPARTTKPKFRVDAAEALIAGEPPARDSVALQRLAVSRLGRDVVDLLGVSVSFGERRVLTGIEWRIGPGDRTGILGVNGAGKSTLLGLVTGTVQPSSGVVKRGATVRVGSLSQAALGSGLGPGEDPDVKVADLLASRRTTYRAGGRELTPAQLLERLGFTGTHLQAPVGRLSGGQRRRLQLLLTLLDEPNVLVLDEPTNDLDTEMLAVMEDLLDSWPGTLLVVSHDRYLLERVTDQQYAILDGRLRHLPGGVDEYLSLRAAAPTLAPARATADRPADRPTRSAGRKEEVAERRAAAKELAAVERQLASLPAEIAAAEEAIAAHDQRDYLGVAALAEGLGELNRRLAALEDRWLELSALMETTG